MGDLQTTGVQTALQFESFDITEILGDFLPDDKQKEAIQLCCEVTKRIVGVTGPAGTGKTTIIRIVYEILTKMGYKVELAAPTGKAAKRIREATGIFARTLHLLLEFTHPGDPDEKTGKPVGISFPRRDRERPLEADVVLVDEYAMVNRDLHNCTIAALKPGARVLVFGDVNQLPPIEEDDFKREQRAESPFEEILRRFPSVRLETVHRTGAGSGIAFNAARVLQGHMPLRRPDFVMHVTGVPLPLLDKLVAKLLDEGVDLGALDNQIIVAQNKSICGTHSINARVQNILDPGPEDEENPWIHLPRQKWDIDKPCRVRRGTKIIFTKNDYQLGVMNGETGIVTSTMLDEDLDGFTVDLGDREVKVPSYVTYEVFDPHSGESVTKGYDPRKDIYLAYCITTHKGQGSEYKVVIYLMNSCMYFMQVRSNLYTGLTRARDTVHLITDQRSLLSSVRTVQHKIRKPKA
jgi:exodeoxyribonuclease V alpha subunit